MDQQKKQNINMKWPLMVWLIHVIIFDGLRYKMMDRTNLIQINISKTRTQKPGSSKYRLRGINHSNLIEITTDFKELKFFHTSKVKLGLINVQLMKNKEITLLDHITENDLDFLIITETWLTDSTVDSQWKTTSQLTTKPLRLLSQNRDGQRGDRSALIHKEPYTVDVKSADTRDSFEYMIVECRTKSDTFSK